MTDIATRPEMEASADSSRGIGPEMKQVGGTETSEEVGVVYDFEDPFLRKTLALHLDVPEVTGWKAFNYVEEKRTGDKWIPVWAGLIVQAYYDADDQVHTRETRIDDKNRPFSEEVIASFGRAALLQNPKLRQTL